MAFPFRSVYGVDFSGAKQAGKNIWVARIERRKDRHPDEPPYALTHLSSMERLCGSADRAPSLAHLVQMILASQRALWAIDFPFGLPTEVLHVDTCWPEQFRFLGEWGEDAYGAGLECLRRAKLLGGPMHIRRLTDGEAKAPFDCYHYRIIYHSM